MTPAAMDVSRAVVAVVTAPVVVAAVLVVGEGVDG